MIPANIIFAAQMKPDSVPAKLQVNIKITKGRNVSTEVNTLSSANQKGKSR